MTRPQVRRAPKQVGDVQVTFSASQEQANEPPQTTLIWPSISYVDPILLVQLVKAEMEGMTSATTPMLVPLSAPIAQTISKVATATTTNNMVHLVLLVKIMREMGCEPYLGEQDVKVAGRWIRKVEKTMIQIKIPNDLHVDYAT